MSDSKRGESWGVQVVQLQGAAEKHSECGRPLSNEHRRWQRSRCAAWAFQIRRGLESLI